MPEHLSSILDSTEPTRLTTGWGRTEGPLWHAAGSVTCVDVAGSRLLRWDTSGQVCVVRERTGEGNGCTLDRQGRLIMCEGADHRRLTRMDAEGTVTTIAERWQGQRFNKPNDVVCRSDGSRFFTTLRCAWHWRDGRSTLPACIALLRRGKCIWPPMPAHTLMGWRFRPRHPSCTWPSAAWTSGALRKNSRARCARTAASAPLMWLRMAVSAPIVCSVLCPRPIPVCPMASQSIPPVGCCASAPAASW
jgi:SMP-30/Gluconolactonase/LRE-like region